MPVPTYDKMFNPVLEALKQLGGSASIGELEQKVAEIMNLSEADISQIYKGSRTKFNYRLAWARTYLKSYGLLENSSKGVWALTLAGRQIEKVNPRDVVTEVRKKRKRKTDSKDPFAGMEDVVESWRESLLNEIMQLSPEGFERLVQRILRESGFLKVEVTGRSGDGGIDGRGVFSFGGLVSFHIIFQCKRYVGSVSSKQIRDFRGAMIGRTDKGLFITTGTFTKDAVAEAARDGAPPIDLIDGNQLVEKMKDLGLGVKREMEEVVEVDAPWFKNF
ncbi:MAG: restriction endonuclease [Candidatus Doudnabacteria bacterium]|nr:restriction endonuclease [Candidatus Doudnabacteria bacterium]